MKLIGGGSRNLRRFPELEKVVDNLMEVKYYTT
jgi:hypothetical protein